MKRLLVATVAVVLAVAAPGLTAQAPQIGQVSKDSVWVPTPERTIRRMLQLADLAPGELLIDLGSGDGRIPIHAAKHFGARAIGVELEKNLVDLSVKEAKTQGVSQLARFVQQDLFQADLSQANVIALYISPSVMSRLKPKLLALRPGTRVVSHHFTLEDWEPDETVRTENRSAYLWVVPADVRGSWTVAFGDDKLRLQVDQSYQALKIRGARAGRAVHVIGASLRGTEIRFTSFDPDGNSRHFHGAIEGGRMQGTSEGQEIARLAWTALREP